MIISDLDTVEKAIELVESKCLTVSPQLKRLLLQSEIDTEYILEALNPNEFL